VEVQLNIFICHILFKLSTVQLEAFPQIWGKSTWPEQGIFIQLTDVLSRASSRVTSVHRLSMLFLNSWRVSNHIVSILVMTLALQAAIQKQQWHSRKAQIELSYSCLLAQPIAHRVRGTFYWVLRLMQPFLAYQTCLIGELTGTSNFLLSR
jgi:hypothetical protein